MRSSAIITLIVTLGLATLLGCGEVIPVQSAQESTPTKPQPVQAVAPQKVNKDIYDVKADAKAVIAKAVAQAKKENKQVLITWGGNWCGWCHLLHGTFENNSEINATLKKNFVRVTVDTQSNKTLMKEMKVVPQGVPYLTVLDGNGKKLMDQATGPLEVGHAHDPKKVMAFLKKAHPKNQEATPVVTPAPNAETKLSTALAQLKRDDQRLFVKFSTQSCGWCKRLDAFLDDNAIQPILAKDFAFVEMDQGQLPGAKELRTRLSTNKPSGGVPWFAILDKEGNVLSTATASRGNIGYPAEPEGIVHFMNMITKASTTIEDTEFATVEKELKVLGKKFGY